MKIKDLFSDYQVKGIFTRFLDVQGVSLPWGPSQQLAYLLDLSYMGHSAFKNVNSLVRLIINDVTGSEEQKKQIIANIVYQQCKNQFNQLWEAWISEYNPIENYDRYETENSRANDIGTVGNQSGNSKTNVKSATITNTYNSTNKTTYNSTDTTTFNTTDSDNKTGNSTEEDSRYAFNQNSTTPTPTDKKNITISENDTKTKTGTETLGKSGDDTLKHTGDDTLSDSTRVTDTGSSWDTRTDNLEHTLNRGLHIHGNIGVTTATQMLNEQKEFWENWDVWESIFNAIDKVITLQIY